MSTTCETVDRSLGLLCDEGDQLAERIAVAMLGVAGEIAFGDDMLQQEAPNPGAKKLRQSWDGSMA